MHLRTVLFGLLIAAGWALSCHAAIAGTASAPASAPAITSTTDRPLVTRIDLTLAGSAQHQRRYLLRRPGGHGPGQRPALLICLHGTDDTAEQMVAFWSALKPPFPLLIAAPQGVAPGWCDDDMPTIQAMLEHLRAEVPHDENRVLLAGFSAGGSMAFELLYKQRVPLTAVAALANYVPPRLLADEVRAVAGTPVLYAVGMTDLNHERMRAGLEFLRGAGANIELYRPEIGHVLDPAVAQTALDWLGQQCRRRTAALLADAARERTARRVFEVECVASQPAWQWPDQAAEAARLLPKLEADGARWLGQARDARAAQPGRSLELLRQVRDEYGEARLGREAAGLLRELEADPLARADLEARLGRERAAEADALYGRAQRLVAERRLGEAAEVCRRVVSLYGDTPAAERARTLLGMLTARGIK